MNNFKKYINTRKVVIGMVHVPALPGTPGSNLSPEEIIKSVITEAFVYKRLGLKAIMIENMNDVPYMNSKIGHEISTMMSIIGYEIKRQTGLFCGIQILAAANKEALATAHSAGMDFIRAEGFVFGHLADEGFIESSAAELLRYRKLIDAKDVMIFTDIKKKHSSHAISGDTSIVEHAHAAEFFLSDGVIVTGKSTGLEANLEELISVKKAVNLPVIVGSGITTENISKYIAHADGVIVGSYFKRDGLWQNPPDENRIARFMHEFAKH